MAGGDGALDLLERDALLDLPQHLRVAGLDAELERLEVRGLEQAHELLVDAIDPCLRRETDAAVEPPLDDSCQDRLRPAHVQPERLVLDPDPLRPVALEDLLDLVEDVGGRPVTRLEARVVAAEHTLERAAAMRDQRERPDGPEEVPGREREERRSRREAVAAPRHDLGAIPRDEAWDRRGIEPRSSASASSHARYSPSPTHAKSKPSPSSSACRPTALTCAPPTTIGTSARSRLIRRAISTARGYSTVMHVIPTRSGGPRARASTISSTVRCSSLPSSNSTSWPGGPERARDVRDAEPREARPMPVELTARRRL